MHSSKLRHTDVNVAEILHWDLTAAHNKALTLSVKQELIMHYVNIPLFSLN